MTLISRQENPKLWYGIGILYDRYGSLDNAEEAFSSVLKMDKGGSILIGFIVTSRSLMKNQTLISPTRSFSD